MWVAGGLQVFVISKDVSIDSFHIATSLVQRRSIKANAAVIVDSLKLG